MKISIKKSLQGLMLVPVLALGVSVVAPVVPVAQAQLTGGIDAAIGDNNKTEKTLGELIATAVDWFLYIVGALAVIMIIYGGFRYITSGGDSSGVTNAKNTILYAIIGLIVAVLAYAIVHFVVGSGSGDGGIFGNPS